MKINDILDQTGSDVLTEDTKNMLIEAFNEAVDKSTQDRVDVEVQNALTKLDEEHTIMLNTLLEEIDNDHTKRLQAVLTKIDEDHTEKLQYLIKKNQKLIKEDASGFKSQLVKQLSTYLDLYLEDAVPRSEIAEAVANKQAQRTLREIKQLVAIDEDYINDTIREAVADGKQTIDNLKSELNEAVKQNIRLNQAVKTNKSALILEQSMSDYSKPKKDYVKRVLSGKSPEYITENLDYVVKMFEKDEAERTQVLTEQATTGSKTLTNKVDVPKSKITSSIINESTDHEDEGAVSEYLVSLKRQDGVRDR